MPLMVTIQQWVFITTCRSRQYDFNLVHHPTPEKQIFSYSEKNVLSRDLNPGPQPQNPEYTHTLDRSAMAPLSILISCQI